MTISGDEAPLGEEVSLAVLRARTADVMNSLLRGNIHFVTNRGRRIAGLVPLAVAEAIEVQRPRPDDEEPPGVLARV